MKVTRIKTVKCYNYYVLYFRSELVNVEAVETKLNYETYEHTERDRTVTAGTFCTFC